MTQPTSQELEQYLRTVAAYESEFAKWNARVKKVLKRYRDDTRGQSLTEGAKFNILWRMSRRLFPPSMPDCRKPMCGAGLVTAIRWVVSPPRS